MKARLTFITEVLGTQPGNPEVFQDYVASKNPDAEPEELGTTVEEVEKKSTLFRRDASGNLCLVDYMIKGHIKAVGSAISQRRKAADKTPWTAFKSRVDMNVHVFPRMISFGIQEPDGILERPLRAETARGPRVSLARSEMVNAGRSVEVEIITRGIITEAQIRECLDEGKFYGISQWRNAGYGRYEWEEVK